MHFFLFCNGLNRFEDLEEKDDLLNKLINDKVVCRLALAISGLFNIQTNTLI